MQDISFDELRQHLVKISIAITDARKDVYQRGMTWMNSDVYQYLKKAQDEIDTLRVSIQPGLYKRYRTNTGEPAHGYMFACYKCGDKYYGHANFGHDQCEEKAQAQFSQSAIPLEEFLTFLRDAPNDENCTICGKN